MAIFLARAMFPFMELIRVGSQKGKQPDVPCEQVEAPGADDKDGREQNQIPRSLPPTMPRHETWIVMMHGVWAAHDPAKDRRGVADVGVLKPMDKSGGEFRGEQCGDELREIT